jgi:hypothetical protein
MAGEVYLTPAGRLLARPSHVHAPQGAWLRRAPAVRQSRREGCGEQRLSPGARVRVHSEIHGVESWGARAHQLALSSTTCAGQIRMRDLPASLPAGQADGQVRPASSIGWSRTGVTRQGADARGKSGKCANGAHRSCARSMGPGQGQLPHAKRNGSGGEVGGRSTAPRRSRASPAREASRRRRSTHSWAALEAAGKEAYTVRSRHWWGSGRSSSGTTRCHAACPALGEAGQLP